MRIGFIWSFYERYLNDFYFRFPELVNANYSEQYTAFLGDYFGSPGSQVLNLMKAGHNSLLIINNCEILQKQWAKENNFNYNETEWKEQIALEQLKRFKPDVAFTGLLFTYYGDFIDEVKKISNRVFAWISCPIPTGVPLHKLDLILSSNQKYVDTFRSMGINSELLPTSFDSDILTKLDDVVQDIPVSFIGGLSNVHKERVLFLKELSRRTPVKIWGYDPPFEHKSRFFKIFNPNTFQARYKGSIWGMEMYRVIKRSKITFNMHIAEAENLAGNMRMYEATGLGSLLVSDFKTNANELFEDSRQAVYYHSIDDAVDKINYYLKHEQERKTIAEAGQQRTLKEYTFEVNCKQMIQYFEKYLYN